MPWSGVQPPQEPANYDPNDKFKDPVAYFKHREAAVAEKFVQTAEAKLLRKQLRQCYRDEGVNYLTSCKELAQKYLESIKGVGVYRANSGPFDKPVWAKPATEDK